MRVILCEGLDRVGKTSLIHGIQMKLGYHQVMHFGKPFEWPAYGSSLRAYQEASFRNVMGIVRDAKQSRLILDRSWIGEACWAPLYRGYSGNYVFEMEKQYDLDQFIDIKVVMLHENLQNSVHFEDDGLSLGPVSARAKEQELLSEAVRKSAIHNKQFICVTASNGAFRSKESILEEALS